MGSDTPVGTFPRTHIGGGEPILGLSEAIRDGGSTASEASGTRWEGPRTLPAGPKGLAARSSGPPFSPRRFPGLEGGRAEKRAKNPFSWKGEEDYRVADPQC